MAGAACWRKDVSSAAARWIKMAKHITLTSRYEKTMEQIMHSDLQSLAREIQAKRHRQPTPADAAERAFERYATAEQERAARLESGVVTAGDLVHRMLARLC